MNDISNLDVSGARYPCNMCNGWWLVRHMPSWLKTCVICSYHVMVLLLATACNFSWLFLIVRDFASICFQDTVWVQVIDGVNICAPTPRKMHRERKCHRNDKFLSMYRILTQADRIHQVRSHYNREMKESEKRCFMQTWLARRCLWPCGNTRKSDTASFIASLQMLKKEML